MGVIHTIAQAADALRVVGVGRNEYISILNACKAKKLMWRVNRAIAKDLLPQVRRASPSCVGLGCPVVRLLHELI